jgi:hypothetical protein
MARVFAGAKRALRFLQEVDLNRQAAQVRNVGF